MAIDAQANVADTIAAHGKVDQSQDGLNILDFLNKRHVLVKDGLNILDFLNERHVLVTGATGFLAKVLIEKILWEQPGIGSLNLLIQGEDPQQRLHDEIIASKVFGRLRARLGKGYKSFMANKLRAIPGALQQPELGIPAKIREELQDNVDLVLHSAAVTTFDEQFQVSITVNTLGALKLALFAAGCKNRCTMVHISTAYVNGLRKGVAKEVPYAMGETPNYIINGGDAPKVDVQKEVGLGLALAGKDGKEVPELAPFLVAAKGDFKKACKDLGMARAQTHGWQDSYAFTKSMGEMLVREVCEREGIPAAIVRPSIVESALKYPYSGWIEGIKVADPIIVAYGRGRLPGFVFDKDLVLDCVPVDFVTNVILVAAAAQSAPGAPPLKVYHAATSVVNPVTGKQYFGCIYEHLKECPMQDRHGNIINVKPFKQYNNAHHFEFDCWRAGRRLRKLAKNPEQVLDETKPQPAPVDNGLMHSPFLQPAPVNNRVLHSPFLQRSDSAEMQPERARNELERTGSELECTGSGLERTGSGMERTGSGLERTGSALQRMGSGLERTGSALQRMGSALQRTGSGLQRSGSGLQRLGSGLQRTGSGLQRSGSKMSRTSSAEILKVYHAYTHWQCRFDSSNVADLHQQLAPDQREAFVCDLTRIDWHDYCKNTHVPGMRKYALQDPTLPAHVLPDNTGRRRSLSI